MSATSQNQVCAQVAGNGRSDQAPLWRLRRRQGAPAFAVRRRSVGEPTRAGRQPARMVRPCGYVNGGWARGLAAAQGADGACIPSAARFVHGRGTRPARGAMPALPSWLGGGPRGPPRLVFGESVRRAAGGGALADPAPRQRTQRGSGLGCAAADGGAAARPTGPCRRTSSRCGHCHVRWRCSAAQRAPVDRMEAQPQIVLVYHGVVRWSRCRKECTRNKTCRYWRVRWR